jgi:hypothetical protein
MPTHVLTLARHHLPVLSLVNMNLNPARRNKIDLSQLSPEELNAFRKYGKLPNRPIPRNKIEERKYFDSGDYELQKAGRSVASVGLQHPSPEQIPHSTTPAATTNSSSATIKTPTTGQSHLTPDATKEVLADDKGSNEEATAV